MNQLMKPKSVMRAMVGLGEPAGRAVTQGTSAVRHRQLLYPNCLDSRGETEGEGYFLVGWGFPPPPIEKFCLPCRGGKGKQVNSGVKYGLENLFADFLNIFN